MLSEVDTVCLFFFLFGFPPFSPFLFISWTYSPLLFAYNYIAAPFFTAFTIPCPLFQVVRALDSEGESTDLTNGVKYGQSTIYDSGQYNQDIQRFRRMALGDDSSEYDMYSGEYQSKEVSLGAPTSSTLTESETQAMNGK